MKNEADPTKQKWSFGTIFKVLGSIVAVFVAIYAATTWVHATARAAVLDETFLATLSTRVRPICVFDSNGSIEIDLGAGEYIDAKNMQVTPLPDIYGFSIRIPAKRPLTYAPLVSGLDVSLFPDKVERGKGYDWNIVLAPRGTASNIIDSTPMDIKRPYRFKVEILH